MVRGNNQQAAESFVNANNLGFIVTTRSRYLGGYVGDASALDKWLKAKISDWSHGIQELAQVASSHPQSAYAGLQKSLQHEWAYVQRVVEGTSEHFIPLEEALTTTFLPSLFGERSIEDAHRRPLAALPVKHAGLEIPNPVATSDSSYKLSTLVCGHLIGALRLDSDVQFSQVDHSSTRKENIAAMRKRKTKEHESKLTTILSTLDADTACTVKRGKVCGQWLSVMPSRVSGTELSPQEFRDNLLLRYGRTPGDLPAQCDGCGGRFTVSHALDCKKGGLVMLRHNEIQGEVTELGSKALSPSAVRVEPLIHLDSSTTEDSAETPKSNTDPNQSTDHAANDGKRGDVLIRGLYKRGMDTIIDV